MKKALILTLYDNANYGNRWQNYAVQETLRKMGLEVSTVALVPSLMKFRLRFYYDLGKGILKQPFNLRRAKAHKFNKKYNTIIPCKIDKFPSKKLSSFDYYVVGSDQVWNPNLDATNRQNYFLSFCERKRRICLAPSFGISELPSEYVQQYKKAMDGFKYLSCRESDGIRIIKEITGRDAELLIDPTLALSKEEWERKLNLKSIITPQVPYMIVSLLGQRTDSQNQLISQIKHEKKLIEINPFDSNTILSPAEMLAYILHAKIVITDSFHFSAFSINFNTPFVSLQREGTEIETKMFSRITGLLSEFSLESRLSNHITMENVMQCDFSEVNKRLSIKRKEYYDYLLRCISLKEE